MPRTPGNLSVPDVPTPESRPPSERQREFVRDLLERTGASPEEAEARIAVLTTSREASVLIDQLREQVA